MHGPEGHGTRRFVLGLDRREDGRDREGVENPAVQRCGPLVEP